MSHFLGVGIFGIGLNRTDRGCWRLTLIRIKKRWIQTSGRLARSKFVIRDRHTNRILARWLLFPVSVWGLLCHFYMQKLNRPLLHCFVLGNCFIIVLRETIRVQVYVKVVFVRYHMDKGNALFILGFMDDNSKKEYRNLWRGIKLSFNSINSLLLLN